MKTMKQIREDLEKYLSKVIIGIISSGFLFFILKIQNFFKNHIYWSLVFSVSLVVFIMFYEQFLVFLKRVYNRLFRLSLNIGVIIKINDCGDYFDEIIGNVQNSISPIQKLIKLTDLSKDEKVNSNKEAQNLILKYNNLHLLIWGDFSKKMTVSGRAFNRLRLHFVWQYRDDNSKKVHDNLINFFSVLFGNKGVSYDIFEDNSFPSISYISNELCFYCKYMIAVLFKNDRKMEESIFLLDSIDKANLNKEIVEKINLLLIENLNLLVINFLNKLGRIRGSNLTDSSLFEKNILFCKRILAIDSSNAQALCGLAYLEYKNNPETGNYIEAINNMATLYPTDTSSLVNLAFLHIVQKKYSKAYSRYKQINHCNFNLADTLEHLDSEFKRTGEAAFMFGAAYLSYHFGVKDITKQYLFSFLEHATVHNYGHMYNYGLKMQEQLLYLK